MGLMLCLSCVYMIEMYRTNLDCAHDTHRVQQRPVFDFIVDGANVGYRGQNFEGGGFSYEQIDLVLKVGTSTSHRWIVLTSIISITLYSTIFCLVTARSNSKLTITMY